MTIQKLLHEQYFPLALFDDGGENEDNGRIHTRDGLFVGQFASDR